MPAQDTFLVHVYVTYAALAVGLTVYLARTLFRTGTVFLEDVFHDKRMADSVNRLLVIGFYMLNLGYALMTLRAYEAGTPVAAIETLASKLGTLLLTLGVVHFGNLYLFHRIRRRAQVAVLPPPVAPQLRVQLPEPAYVATPV